MEKSKLDSNQAPIELLKTFDPALLKSKREKDTRFVSGFLLRITRDDADKLTRLIKKELPNATLFYIKLFDSNESVFLVSRTDLEDAKVERHRQEIEEHVPP
jgi:hypothetical protein